MVAEALVVPLWGKIAALSLAKKGLILTAGYLYGFPRLYRRSQKLVRRVSRDSETRKSLQSGVRTAFRLPARLLHSERKKPASPALQYLSALPRRLLPRAKQDLPVASVPEKQLKAARLYRRLRTSFASSALVQRQSESLAAGRMRLVSLKERLAYSSTLQDMVEGRAAHAAQMWRKVKQQPYNLIPAVQ